MIAHVSILRASSDRRFAPATRTSSHWGGAVDVAALLMVTVVAAALRLFRLGRPAQLIFDEVYYAKDACWYVKAAETLCGTGGEQTAVHPPLGKWLIGAGIELFGYDPFGRRVAAVAAGTLTIALTYVLGRRLLGSTMGALIGAGLLALDPLHFVQSRVAMLDVFVTGLGVAVFLFLVLDRQAERRPWRPWLAGAGAAAGASLATKWSGALVVVAAPVMVLIWDAGAARSRGERSPLAATLRRDGPVVALWLVALPAAVYAVGYIGRLDGALVAAPWEQGTWLRALVERQLFMFDFHSNLSDTHAYQSPPWSWPLLKRPVSYYFEVTGSGDYKEVLATGSPLVWWSSLLALGAAAWSWLRWRDPDRPEGVILAGFAWSYAPWFLLAGDRSAVFLFYLLPALPFMCLALALVAVRASRTSGGAAVVGSFCVVAALLFAFYFPLLSGTALPYQAWRARIWRFDSCQEVAQPEKTGSGDELPPTGWCWI
ncbi:phospholipid carrier-dependent glycosyltransferase [soil metagenome]